MTPLNGCAEVEETPVTAVVWRVNLLPPRWAGSSVRRGSQVACASPSPLSSGAAGPRHRRRPWPEHHRYRGTSPRRLHSTPARRAAARVSPRCRHLVRCVVAALTVLTPPFSGHLVRWSMWASRQDLHCSRRPDSVHALFKHFLFPFYLNKFLFQTFKIRINL
jgi:hypothetical protein